MKKSLNSIVFKSSKMGEGKLKTHNEYTTNE